MIQKNKNIIIIGILSVFVFLLIFYLGRLSKQDKWNENTESTIQSWCATFEDGDFQMLNNIPVCVSFEKSTDKKYNEIIKATDSGNCILFPDKKYRICPIVVDPNISYSFFDPDKTEIIEEKIEMEVKF